MPRGVEDLVESVGFSQSPPAEVVGEALKSRACNVTMTPCKHWGARMFRDTHRGYGGYVIEGGGQSVYHSGDTAYFDGFREIGRRLKPQVALLPIGAYFPDSYRSVHTSPEEARTGFVELGAAADGADALRHLSPGARADGRAPATARSGGRTPGH